MVAERQESIEFEWVEWEGVTPLFDHNMVLYYLDRETGEVLTTATEDSRTGVKLSPREREVLSVLVESGGVKIPARILGEEIWRASSPRINAQCAREYISLLRKRLGQISPELAGNLETSDWYGYVWKWEENPYSPVVDCEVSCRSNQW